MSDTNLSEIPIAAAQAYIGSEVESTILQSFFTGLYVLLYFQTIIQLSRQGRWTILTIMTGLFITTILNLISVWYIIYHDIVIHDATRETMAETVVLSPAASNQRLTYGHATLALSILIADGFLAWRAYILWERNRIIGILYSAVFIIELVALPIYLARNIVLGRLGFMATYVIVSFITTVIATVLILYKIIDVSKQGNNQLTRYQYTMKILVESGMLYITVMLISATFHFLQDSGNQTPAVVHGAQDFDAILVPVTGIAPTLIIARIAAVRSGSEVIVSGLNFRREEESNIEFPTSAAADIEANSNDLEVIVSQLGSRRNSSYSTIESRPTSEMITARNPGEKNQTRTV